jgi:hypothetical protein
MTRSTAFAFGEPVDYEVERGFVFCGLEDRVAVDMRGMGAEELVVQVELLGGLGCCGGRGVVRVVMGVEIGGDNTSIGGGRVGYEGVAAAAMAVLGELGGGVGGKEGE